jgi:hypothetical protein
MGRSVKEITVEIDISDETSYAADKHWQRATELLFKTEQRHFVVSSAVCSGAI